MIPGKVIVYRSLLEQLLSGLGSSASLRFETPHRAETVIRGLNQRAGHQCRSCGAVTVYPLTREWTRPS